MEVREDGDPKRKMWLFFPCFPKNDGKFTIFYCYNLLLNNQSANTKLYHIFSRQDLNYAIETSDENERHQQ